VLNLLRPYNGRAITGALRGLSEYYEIPVGLLRLVFFTAFLASPVVLLLYLCLAISMPSEGTVLSELRLANPSEHLGRLDRFDSLAHVLLKRISTGNLRHRVPPQLLALGLLLLGFAFELPRVEGSDFYYTHPILSSIYTSVSRHGAALFYLSMAITFFITERSSPTRVQLRTKRMDRFILDGGSTKAIGGIASGIARVIGIDPAYIRVLFILLNLLTFGLVGIIYLIVFWMMRRSNNIQRDHSDAGTDSLPRRPLPQGTRFAIGILFILLAVIRVSTELRLFFFNESFFRGAVLVAAGMILAVRGLKYSSDNNRLCLLAGAAIFFLGIFDFSTAIFRVQLSLGGQFEVAYFIGGLTLLYFTIVNFRGNPQRIGFALTTAVILAALLVQFNLTPERFLLALVQFYDFFFPVIFAGFGFWLIMER
jgi:phage shock protein PspC (stress-responsive transcriptional regulator)